MTADTTAGTAVTTPPIDLGAFDTKSAAERGIKVELENPFTNLPFLDDEKKPYFIRILGGDADKVREKSRKQLDKYIELIRKNQSPGDSLAGEADNIDKLSIATIEWYLPPLDGQPMPPASVSAARKLYSDPRFPWIVEQVTKAINDRTRFFSQSSSS